MAGSSRRTVLTLVALFALGAAALALAGCGGGSKSEPAEAHTETQSATDVSGMSSVDLEADDNYFDPKTLNGKPGQKLTIEIENEGKAEHNFSIDTQSIDKDVEAGEKASITVTLPQSGTVTFYCKYHRASGMVGKLAAGGATGGAAGGTTTNSGSSGY